MAVAHQSCLFLGFSQKGYWNGLPFSSPGYFPDSGIKPAFPAMGGGFFDTEPSVKTKQSKTFPNYEQKKEEEVK